MSSPIAHRLYLAHLIAPGFLLWDAVQAYQRGFAGRSLLALIALGGVWMLFGLALWAMRRRTRVARLLPKLTLAFFTVLLCVILLETAISMIFPVFRTGVSHIYRPPKLKIETVNNPVPVPGSVVNTVFTTNELGMRGPSLEDKARAFRVLAIGGSTTECFALDDSKTWPYLLMKVLEGSGGVGRVSVQNAGLGGHTSIDHLYMLRTNLVAKEADLVLFLVGVNDLAAALAFEGRSTEADLERHAAERFAHFPRYSRSAIFKLLKSLTAARSELRYDEAGFYETMRNKRRSKPLLPAPDLRPAIDEYGKRIRQLAEECQKSGKRCVFMTQPTLWHATLSREEDASLWFGGLGRKQNYKGYLAPADLKMAMDGFNRQLLESARAEGVEAFDLSAQVPKTSSVFYDDAHFTNEGARVVAEKVYEYLRSAPRRKQSSRTRVGLDLAKPTLRF